MPRAVGTEASSTLRATWTHTVRAVPTDQHLLGAAAEAGSGATSSCWSVKRNHQGIQEALKQGMCISFYFLTFYLLM